MRQVLTWILGMVAFALAAVFAYHNAVPVTVDYLAGRSERPLALWLLITFGCGIVLTLLVDAIRALSLRQQVRDLGRRLAKTEAELQTLRELGSGKA